MTINYSKIKEMIMSPLTTTANLSVYHASILL